MAFRSEELAEQAAEAVLSASHGGSIGFPQHVINTGW
jgi:hypothetical protein